MKEEDLKKWLLRGGSAAAGAAVISSALQKSLPAKILFPAGLLSLSGYGYLKNKERRQLGAEGLAKTAFFQGFINQSSKRPDWLPPIEGALEAPDATAPADPIPSA